ncbi:MAG: HIRAN domain-containing protein [Rhodospirillaceae bacterium]|nr:HIRAN domain-containing protein [Rhodospirillaceae bacterium]
MRTSLRLLLARRRFLTATVASGLAALPVSRRPAAAPLPVWLDRVTVAGPAYYDARRIWQTLTPGAPLELRRQPDNPHDALAIEVFTSSGEKLGYVPRINNAPYARLMDAGRPVTARLADAAIDNWYAIEIDLSLAP